MAQAPETVGALLGRCLVALGASRVFIAGPVSDVAPTSELGLDLHPVGDPALAALLAAADGRIGPGPGVALLDGRRLLLTSAPGVEPDVVEVTDPACLPGALAGWTLEAGDPVVHLARLGVEQHRQGAKRSHGVRGADEQVGEIVHRAGPM